MHFASDNSGPAHPSVMDALARANDGYAMGYGADALMGEVTDRIRDLFEAPQAAVYLVSTGTTANVLALASLCQPYQTIFCSHVAHIHEDECNAPEFFTGGAKLTLVGGGDKMTPDALRTAIEGEENRGVHGPGRGPVSITNVTERGNVHSVAEVTALCDVARGFGLPVHLDGARLSNALVAEGCRPADMTWRAGVDVAVFGGTKNGLMGAEAVVFFNPEHAASFEYRRKRGGHLFSKHRYLSAQMAAYLRDDLWHDMASRANANMARLADGLRNVPHITFAHGNKPDANMLFFTMPRARHRALLDAGAVYHIFEGSLEGDNPDTLITGRLVSDWSSDPTEIDRFVALAAG